MAIRKIRLTEAQLTRLIGRIVEEAEHEMEEGWLGDKFKDVKRFTTGYGDESEKTSAQENFEMELGQIEMEVMSDMKNFRYEDEEAWEEAKEDLMRQAERNNYLGELEIMYPRRTGKAFVKYHTGRSRGGKFLDNLGSSATAGMNAGHTFGGGRKGGSLG